MAKQEGSRKTRKNADSCLYGFQPESVDNVVMLVDGDTLPDPKVHFLSFSSAYYDKHT